MFTGPAAEQCRAAPGAAVTQLAGVLLAQRTLSHVVWNQGPDAASAAHVAGVCLEQPSIGTVRPSLSSEHGDLCVGTLRLRGSALS